jgi:cell division transport system permease protein
MKNWWTAHRRSITATLQRIRRAPVSSLLSTVVIGVALSLPAGMYVVLENMKQLMQQVDTHPQMSIFLKREANRNDLSTIEFKLKQSSSVQKYLLVSRDQALADMRKNSELATILDNLKQNPLPDTFIVWPKNESMESLEALQKEFKQWSGVAQVQLDAIWIKRVALLFKLARLVVFMLAAVLSIALVAVTFNTIRLQVLMRRDEIEVSQLIGATAGFIRRPFLYYGALQALMGGLLAWLLIAVSLYCLNFPLSELTALYGVQFKLQHFNLSDSLSFLVFAAALGWAGAWLSVSHCLSSTKNI